MELSVEDERLHSHAASAISFWLKPESRMFAGMGTSLNSDHWKKLTRLDSLSDLDISFLDDVVEQALTRAEYLLIEYAALDGFKIPSLNLPREYSLVSKIPTICVENELNFHIHVLTQLLVNDKGEQFDERFTRLRKMTEAVKDETVTEDVKLIFETVYDRIQHGMAVSQDEVNLILEDIEKADKGFLQLTGIFSGRLDLLRGVEHLKFLQRVSVAALKHIDVRHHEFFVKAVASIIKRLSPSELTTVFADSDAYLGSITGRPSQIIFEFAECAKHPQNAGWLIAARMLLSGTTSVCQEIAAYIKRMWTVEKALDDRRRTDRDRNNGFRDEKRLRYEMLEKEKKSRRSLSQLIENMPEAGRDMLLQGSPPPLVKQFFSLQGVFREEFSVPLQQLIQSNIVPLERLLSFLDVTKQGHLCTLHRIVNASVFFKTYYKAMEDRPSDEDRNAINTMVLAVVAALNEEQFAMERLKRLVTKMGQYRALGDDKMHTWLKQYPQYETIMARLRVEAVAEEITEWPAYGVPAHGVQGFGVPEPALGTEHTVNAVAEKTDGVNTQETMKSDRWGSVTNSERVTTENVVPEANEWIITEEPVETPQVTVVDNDTVEEQSRKEGTVAEEVKIDKQYEEEVKETEAESVHHEETIEKETEGKSVQNEESTCNLEDAINNLVITGSIQEELTENADDINNTQTYSTAVPSLENVSEMQFGPVPNPEDMVSSEIATKAAYSSDA